jgi:hypothetical protein
MEMELEMDPLGFLDWNWIVLVYSDSWIGLYCNYTCLLGF